MKSDLQQLRELANWFHVNLKATTDIEINISRADYRDIEKIQYRFYVKEGQDFTFWEKSMDIKEIITNARNYKDKFNNLGAIQDIELAIAS